MLKSSQKKASRKDFHPEPIEDARVTRSKNVVLKSTWSLLSEGGLSGLSIDEVSKRSGVAKTTIYRHWKTRTDLIIDACSQAEASQAVPNKGSLRTNLKILMYELAEMLETARWSSILPSIMDNAERDPRISEIHARLQLAHAAPYREVIERAIQSGELPKNTDTATVTAMLMGPLFYRRWFSREPLSKKFIDTVIDSALDR